MVLFHDLTIHNMIHKLYFIAYYSSVTLFAVDLNKYGKLYKSLHDSWWKMQVILWANTNIIHSKNMELNNNLPNGMSSIYELFGRSHSFIIVRKGKGFDETKAISQRAMLFAIQHLCWSSVTRRRHHSTVYRWWIFWQLHSPNLLLQSSDTVARNWQVD